MFLEKNEGLMSTHYPRSGAGPVPENARSGVTPPSINGGKGVTPPPINGGKGAPFFHK